MTQNEANCGEFPRILANSRQPFTEELALCDQVWTLAAHPTEDFQITGTLIGTAEDVATAAIVGRPVSLSAECRVAPGVDNRPACDYTYDGAALRGDGSSFVLRLDAEVGRRYRKPLFRLAKKRFRERAASAYLNKDFNLSYDNVIKMIIKRKETEEIVRKECIEC